MRTVGREAEFPIVSASGEAVDSRRLWQTLLTHPDLEPEYGAGPPGQRDFIVGLKGPNYSYALEVGLGTIEISTRPCQNLYELQELMQEAVSRLVSAATRAGWRVLGYGIQPLTPPQLRILSPKQRYVSLYRAMADPWLWYTVTAADQLHVAIGREEMVRMLNYGNLITPVVIAFCANSPIYAGKESPYCSAREGVMASIRANEHRHGMLPRPMRDLPDFFETISQATYLIARAGGEIVPSSIPFTEYLRKHGADYPAFLFHEHYIWNSARLRAAYGTLEMRPACQQPWPETMAAAALNLGLIEAELSIHPMIVDMLGETYWTQMQSYHQLAIRYGLDAPQPSPDFLERILTSAEEALTARGFGEERLLMPLWRRLERRQNPAQRVRLIFRREGMDGLLNHTTIRPGEIRCS
ncbi:MAG: glutamate-cysteine ligase family protein [Caldilinea sp.]|nr:glutamate-cysteine ligase family protein [Caldilinea sp.]MDW8442148.1 glutamate-cysteine ligase family protein [Caldilineaceae bacterium]